MEVIPGAAVDASVQVICRSADDVGSVVVTVIGFELVGVGVLFVFEAEDDEAEVTVSFDGWPVFVEELSLDF